MFVQVPPGNPKENGGEHPTHPTLLGGLGLRALVPGDCARRAGRRPRSEGTRALHVTRPAGGDADDAPLTWSVSNPVACGGGRGRVPVAGHPEELVVQL